MHDHILYLLQIIIITVLFDYHFLIYALRTDMFDTCIPVHKIKLTANLVELNHFLHSFFKDSLSKTPVIIKHISSNKSHFEYLLHFSDNRQSVLA